MSNRARAPNGERKYKVGPSTSEFATTKWRPAKLPTRLFPWVQHLVPNSVMVIARLAQRSPQREIRRPNEEFGDTRDRDRCASRLLLLRAKHQRFVEEYAKDWNATAAYKRAGCRARGHSAEVNASRLRRRPDVAKAIRQALEDRPAQIKSEAAERSARPIKIKAWVGSYQAQASAGNCEAA